MDLKALTERDETVVIVGFFDLMGFAKWSEGRPPRDLLDLATALFKRTGRTIADAGGQLVKVIGDAGMFVFPADDPDRAVLSLQAMKRDCDTLGLAPNKSHLMQRSVSLSFSRFSASKAWVFAASEAKKIARSNRQCVRNLDAASVLAQTASQIRQATSKGARQAT